MHVIQVCKENNSLIDGVLNLNIWKIQGGIYNFGLVHVFFQSLKVNLHTIVKSLSILFFFLTFFKLRLPVLATNVLNYRLCKRHIKKCSFFLIIERYLRCCFIFVCDVISFNLKTTNNHLKPSALSAWHFGLSLDCIYPRKCNCKLFLKCFF